MHYLANSEDPDKMTHSVAFHHGVHSLLRKKIFWERKKILFGKFTCEVNQFFSALKTHVQIDVKENSYNFQISVWYELTCKIILSLLLFEVG